jgi:hypothetical protein
LQVPQKGSVTLEIRPISPRRPVRARHRLERPAARDSFEDLPPGHQALAVPLALSVERHELDEADDTSRLTGQGGEVEDLVLVLPPQQDDVHLQRHEAGRFRGLHGLQDDREVSPPPDGGEAVRPQ